MLCVPAPIKLVIQIVSFFCWVILIPVYWTGEDTFSVSLIFRAGQPFGPFGIAFLTSQPFCFLSVFGIFFLSIFVSQIVWFIVYFYTRLCQGKLYFKPYIFKNVLLQMFAVILKPEFEATSSWAGIFSFFSRSTTHPSKEKKCPFTT